MPSPTVWTNTAGVFGLVPLAFGLRSLSMPASVLTSTGLASGANASKPDHALPRGLLRMVGMRNIVVSLTLSLCWYRGQREIQGAIVLLMGLMPLVDGFAFKEAVGDREWEHWGFVPVLIGLGAGVLGWLG
ncbi:hypothetical protein PG999_012984 [Apiospora kogelbergensis]|uniref:Uncharacterized protein n=1 Tax=Apiospora kogelbergensis TaxID=1337665 RepID=A0AAW0Q8H4_9PEZI